MRVAPLKESGPIEDYELEQLRITAYFPSRSEVVLAKVYPSEIIVTLDLLQRLVTTIQDYKLLLSQNNNEGVYQ